MKDKKGRAMPDADDARGGEFLIQQFIECTFARFIEGGCCLVEENPVRTDEQDACKSKALLLAE